MPTTITINSETQAVIELLQLTPPPIVDVVQPIPPRVTVIGLPGSIGPAGPPGSDGAPTRVVILPVYGGYGPASNPAVQEAVTSSGGPTLNAPLVTYYQLAFDPDTDQTWFWSFPLPGDYDHGGTLRLFWATKGTSPNPVMWKGATAIGVVGTTDADAAVFDTVITASDIPSTTQGVINETTIDLTMANAAPNRTIIVMQGRDGDDVGDTNPNIAVLLEATFEYERV